MSACCSGGLTGERAFRGAVDVGGETFRTMDFVGSEPVSARDHLRNKRGTFVNGGHKSRLGPKAAQHIRRNSFESKMG